MANKMTKRTALEYVIANCELPEEVEAKLVSMKTQLEKRAENKGERKPTKTQIENEGFKAQIVEFMEPGAAYTISELVKEVPFGQELSVNKVSALVRQLKEAGTVVRTVEKRKAYFSLA